MLVTLEREWYEKCRLRVLEETFSYKDHNKGVKEKVCESRDAAVTEAEKFIQRRLKTGAWKIVAETRENYYLHKMRGLEATISREKNEPGYDEIKCHVLHFHPATFSDLEKLAVSAGVTRERLPQDYQDFLLTEDGFQLHYAVSKKNWGSGFALQFVSTYSQDWFQKQKAEIACLRDNREPFVVVSFLNDVHHTKALTGGVLFLEQGVVRHYDDDIQVGEFSSFREYFAFEMRELGQRFFDARYWVDQKAGSV
jgi:hypothetical protein